MKRDLKGSVVCIVGLGYVGLPLAEAFSRRFRVIGFDTDAERLNQFRGQQVGSRESAYPDFTVTSNPEEDK